MPTVAHIDPLFALLATTSPGEPATHGALTVIPILVTTHPEPDWLTLADAGDAVVITETSEEGSIPVLTVANRADRPVLLLDGEELVGAKQNRVLNTTVLVAARSEVVIPVSCVEAGRWGYRGRRFSPSDASLPASGRARKVARVNDSLRAGLGHVSDQGEVWDDVADMSARLGVDSHTSAMQEVFARYGAEIDKAAETLAPAPGQIGVLAYVATGGASASWAGMDLLPSPTLFARAWRRLCAGYAADALGRARAHTLSPEPSAVMEMVAQAAAERADAVGLGTEFRITGPRVNGAALIVDDAIAHVMAFPTAQFATRRQ